MVAGVVATVAALAAAAVVLVLFVFADETNDNEAIESLARRTVEALPAGEWPSLYESFSEEFQQRCPREEFDAAGEDAAAALQDDLPFLRFNRLESVIIEGGNARAVIVGQVPTTGEYKTRAAFLKENGTWKLTPAAGTEGCQAFRSVTS